MRIAECKELMHKEVNKSIDNMIDTFVVQLNSNKPDIPEAQEWDIFETVIKSCTGMIVSSFDQITEQLKVKMQDKDFMDKIFKETGVKTDE